MIVMKFGGTSVGFPERMKVVAGLILDTVKSDSQVLVVLSAVKGTTDSLVKISELLIREQVTEAESVLNDLETSYGGFIDKLLSSLEYREKAKKLLKGFFDYIHSLARKSFGIAEQLIVIAQGELISTNLFHLYLTENGTRSALLPALNFMRTDKNGDPDSYYIKELLHREIERYPEIPVFITQGFICRDYYGHIANLSRNSSDYTATLLGKAVNASRIELWTDIDGFHNNDPRIVKGITQPIEQMSYDEAIELGYFGAKIVFPDCVVPAQELSIPILLKNTLEPEKSGTIISRSTADTQGVKAISAKDSVTVIHVRSNRRMELCVFLQNVYAIFGKHRTPVDMSAQAEVSISFALTEGKNSHLSDVIAELRTCGQVDVEPGMVIVCIVGNRITEGNYIHRIFDAMQGIPVQQISSGGSKCSVNLLISSVHKDKALNQLHHALLMGNGNK